MPRLFCVYTQVHTYFSAYAIKIIKNIYKNSLFLGWVDGYSGSSTTPARGQLFPTVEITWREYKSPSCVWPKGGRELLILYSVGIPYPSLNSRASFTFQFITGNPCFLEMLISLYVISYAPVRKES